MLSAYPAIFHKEDGAYWVEFPDLPGCQTVGESIGEVMEEAQEALGLYLASLIEDEEEINPVSDKDKSARHDELVFLNRGVY